MRSLYRKLPILLLVLLFAGFFTVALADKQKPDPDAVPLSATCINDRCTIRFDDGNNHTGLLTNGVFFDTLPVPAKSGFTIELPENTLNGGTLYLVWNVAPDFDMTYYDVSGACIGHSGNPHLMLDQAYPLPDACARIKLTAKSKGQLSGLYVYADENSVPENIRPWEPPTGKADLLFVVAHSDDEVVMMGGILPLYAGERGYRVQTVFMSSHNPERYLESLDGLRANRCFRYPRFPGVWNGKSHKDAATELVRVIRETRPEVIVTHDLKGEYGKNAHILTAKAAIDAYTLAADPEYDAESAAKYGVWQTKKLYLHLYEENPITLDFDTPLDSFGERTAFEVAAESFKCYRTQRVEWLETLLANTYDCRKYGLYASTVGPDIAKNDLFEHIEPVP